MYSVYPSTVCYCILDILGLVLYPGYPRTVCYYILYILGLLLYPGYPRTVCYCILDILPDPYGRYPWPDGAASHPVPRPRQHLQHRHHQHTQGNQIFFKA